MCSAFQDLNMSDIDEESAGIQLPLSMNDTFYSQYYIMFENKSNNCWLNSALALLLHNRTLNCTLKSKSGSVLVKIFELYRSVVLFINTPGKLIDYQRLTAAQKRLKHMQNLTLAYLQPLLKCEEGMPDSAFNAVMNLILSDVKARNLFVTSFTNSFECENCKSVRIRDNKKSVITLTAVKSFNGVNPVSLCDCSTCKFQNQKMVLRYRSLPPCLLFHFENGAGEGFLKQTDFMVGGRTYHLSGVVTLDKSAPIPHFITWVRNPANEEWLEFNDLGSEISVFKDSDPKIDLCSIHMLCYETLDQMGVITNYTDTSQIYREPCNYAEIPEITISDDDGECATQNQLNCNIPPVDQNVDNAVQNHYEANSVPSANRPMSNLNASGTELSTGTVTITENLLEKEKCLLKDASSLEHNTALSATDPFCGDHQIECKENIERVDRNDRKQSKKNTEKDKPAKGLTVYEDRLLNLVADQFVINGLLTHFGQKD